jgi:hypothetical protein
LIPAFLTVAIFLGVVCLVLHPAEREMVRQVAVLKAADR